MLLLIDSKVFGESCDEHTVHSHFTILSHILPIKSPY